jgi:uncharacterized surface protein with fasciclin (FAS1) repeats
VIDPKQLERFRTLAIPHARRAGWICADPDGPLQATGRDERGRKQYIYHPRWELVRDQVKFSRLPQFAEALPGLRQQVDQDLQKRTLSRQQVTAIVVSLLDKTRIRIGNPEYTRQNESYGLTTLQDEHVDIAGARLVFTFRGKSQKEHTVELQDRRLARLVKQCQETVTTAPAPAPSDLITTTPVPGAGITTTGALTAPLPPAGTAVTGTVALPTPTTDAVTTTSGSTGTGLMTGTVVATGTGGVGTIYQVISATPNLQTFASVLNAAGMADALALPGPFTVFAPTDDAFAALPAEQEEALLNNPTALAGVLQYHVVIDLVTADQLAQLGAALASSGQPITTTLQADGSLLINNTRIVQPDVVAANGIIHVIDQVLMPPVQ